MFHKERCAFYEYFCTSAGDRGRDQTRARLPHSAQEAVLQTSRRRTTCHTTSLVAEKGTDCDLVTCEEKNDIFCSINVVLLILRYSEINI